MSSFTADDVRQLARLARVELHATEIPTFTRQLNEILAFARQIDAVDTGAAVEPEGRADTTLREDVPGPCLLRESALAGAPDADLDSGLFTVTRVLGDRE